MVLGIVSNLLQWSKKTHEKNIAYQSNSMNINSLYMVTNINTGHVVMTRVEYEK